MVFQKVHWQLSAVTVRVPAEDETVQFSPWSSIPATFFRKAVFQRNLVNRESITQQIFLRLTPSTGQ